MLLPRFKKFCFTSPFLDFILLLFLILYSCKCLWQLFSPFPWSVRDFPHSTTLQPPRASARVPSKAIHVHASPWKITPLWTLNRESGALGRKRIRHVRGQQPFRGKIPSNPSPFSDDELAGAGRFSPENRENWGRLEFFRALGTGERCRVCVGNLPWCEARGCVRCLEEMLEIFGKWLD